MGYGWGSHNHDNAGGQSGYTTERQGNDRVHYAYDVCGICGDEHNRHETSRDSGFYEERRK